MKNRSQRGIFIHYGEGVCNIAHDPKDFYADNIKSSCKVSCTFVERRDNVG